MTSLAGLVVVRILIGAGTAGPYPTAMRIFRMEGERFGMKPPRVALGILSLGSISTSSVGPLVGGLLTATFGWQMIFLINTPRASVTLLFGFLWISTDPPQTGETAIVRFRREVDLLGIGFFAVFLLNLMIFLLNPTEPVWVALVAAGIFGTVFVWHSLRRAQPFLDLRMLVHNRPLSLTYLRAAALQLAVYGFFYGFTQWLESGVGVSSVMAGLFTLPMSAVAAISAVTGVRTRGRYSDHS